MIQCDHCRYFQPDPINPPAGMGRCMHEARHGYWHPAAKHSCRDFDESRDTMINGASTASKGDQ